MSPGCHCADEKKESRNYLLGKYKTNKKLRNILKNERDRETHVLFRKRLHLRMAASTYLIAKVKESNSCEVSLMILHCRGDGLTRS